jgi:predicted transcriptional regulator of viral defense system
MGPKMEKQGPYMISFHTATSLYGLIHEHPEVNVHLQTEGQEHEDPRQLCAFIYKHHNDEIQIQQNHCLQLQLSALWDKNTIQLTAESKRQDPI